MGITVLNLKMNTYYNIRRMNGNEGVYLVLQVGMIQERMAIKVAWSGSFYYIPVENIESIEFSCIL